MVAAVALGALLGTGPAAAVAHPLLRQAAPSPGLITPRSPEAIRLVLAEPVVPRGSEVVVTGPRGRRVPVSKVSAEDGGSALSVRPLRRLASAVYDVRWKVLGDDGHLVGGTFSFGVAGKDGALPPGAERLGAASSGGRGGEDVSGESVLDVVADWLGIIAASFLLGAVALLAALRRRGSDALEDLAERARPLLVPAWLLVGLAASEGVLAGATTSAGDGLDLGLLADSSTGRAQLVRGAVVVGGSLLLALSAGRLATRRRDGLFAGLAVGVLLTYALSGHALADVGALELVAQAAHVLTAGLWLGGLLALLLLARSGVAKLGAGARAFAPLAATSLGIAVVTGVLAAVREVDRWYFLRWSDYGRIVIVKSVLVALVALAGFVAWRRARATDAGATGAPRPRLLRLEVIGVLAVVALAAVLGGLSQGRGRPLPAQEGTLLPGPAFGTALLSGTEAQVALSPGRTGTNTLTVVGRPPAREPRAVTVRLNCACSTQQLDVELRRGEGGTWSTTVDLPAEGQWYAYVSADGRRAAAPVGLPVGVPRAPGADPEELLVLADLSGPGAARCRANVQGLQVAIGRVNAEGGVDDGTKLATLALDDGGDPARSARIAKAALAAHGPVAVAGCGAGAAGGIRQAQAAGVPAVVGDPGVEPLAGGGVFRLAADPYAQGFALAQYLKERVLGAGAAAPGVATLRTAVAQDAIGRRLLAGLEAGLEGTGVATAAIPDRWWAGKTDAQLEHLLDRRRTLGLVLDAPAGRNPALTALERLGRKTERTFPPAPFLGSERVLAERTIDRLRTLGRLGVLQGVSEVSTQTADALAFVRTLPVLWPGERPSLDGLRGYVTGLALRAALKGDLEGSAIRDRLRDPDVFTDALLAPWHSSAPGVGSPAMLALAGQFLSTNLVPPSAGGMRYTGSWFTDGAWINASVRPLGPPVGTPVPPLEG